MKIRKNHGLKKRRKIGTNPNNNNNNDDNEENNNSYTCTHIERIYMNICVLLFWFRDQRERDVNRKKKKYDQTKNRVRRFFFRH